MEQRVAVGILWPEIGDPGRLLVHPALRAGLVEHRGLRVADPGRVDPGVATVGVALGEEHLPNDVGGIDDRRVVERDLVGDPLVVGLDGGRPKEDVLDPVGGDPAGRIAVLDRGAPRVAAVGDDLVAERDELVPRGRNGVAGLREGLDRIPDDGLEVLLVVQAIELAVDRARIDEARAVVGRDRRGIEDPVAQLDELAVRLERLHQTGLGELRDIGGNAAVDADVEDRLVVGDARSRRR